jgi:hypothetical protein
MQGMISLNCWLYNKQPRVSLLFVTLEKSVFVTHKLNVLGGFAWQLTPFFEMSQ